MFLPPHWSNLRTLPPQKLAQLLNLESPTPHAWPQKSTASILRHQLAAPLLPDLLLVPGAEEPRLRALAQNRPGTSSFLDQFAFPHPSLELLTAIKNFARHVRSTPENPLHGTPADILYFTAIAAALLRLQTKITTLPNPDLRAALQWTLTQPIPNALTHILEAALSQLPPENLRQPESP